MARDWEGMARDIAAGLGNIFTLNYEVVHTFSLTERAARKDVVGYGTALVP